MKNKNLNIVLSTRFVSFLGTGIQAIAIPLYILEKTNSGTMMGVFSLFSAIPFIVTMLFAGIIGDRYNKKNIMILSDLVSGAIIAIMALLCFLGNFNIPMLLILQIFVSISNAFYRIASTSISPELFVDDELMKANALKSGVDNITMISSPILGAVLFGIIDIGGIFLVNAISFLVSSVFQIFITYKNDNVRRGLLTLKFKEEFKEVFEFIASTKSLVHLFMFIVAMNFFDVPIAGVIFPYLFKKDVLVTDLEYGLIQGGLIVGMLIGDLLMAYIFIKKPRKNLFKISLISHYILLLVVSLVSIPFVYELYEKSPIQYISMVIIPLFVVGTFSSIMNTIVITKIQKIVPKEIRSRFFSVVQIIFAIANPLGLFVFGVMLDFVHSSQLFIGTAFILLIISILFLEVINGYRESESIWDQ